MATTTTSTRKKTAKTASAAKPAKTTKKTTTTKKTVVAKAPKKTVTTVKTESVTTLKKKVAEPLSLLDRLKAFHAALFLMYVVFTGLVIGFVKTASQGITLPIAAKDEFASNSQTVLTSAHEVLYNVEPKYVLAASLIISGIASLLFSTKLRKRYEATLANRTSGLRWIVVSVAAALLFEYVELLAGITDVWVLKLSGAMILLAGMFNWFAERDNVGAAEPKRLAYWLSLLAGLLAWLPLIGTLIGTSVYADQRFGWHVYVMAGALLIGSLGFAITQYRQFKPAGLQKDYVLIENRYLNFDMLTKFLIVLVSVIALK